MHFPRYTDFQVCVDWGQRLYSKRALDRVPKINLYGHVWTSGTVAIRLIEAVKSQKMTGLVCMRHLSMAVNLKSSASVKTGLWTLD